LNDGIKQEIMESALKNITRALGGEFKQLSNQEYIFNSTRVVIAVSSVSYQNQELPYIFILLLALTLYAYDVLNYSITVFLVPCSPSQSETICTKSM
jgi:hypothetical protein